MTRRPLPTTGQLLAPVALGAALIAAMAALTGCTQIVHEIQRVHEESYPDRETAAAEWVGVAIPDWIPDDATELRNLATFDETQSVVRVASASDPVGCVEQPRSGLPFQTTDWAPSEATLLEDGSLIDTVWVCGDYEVIAMDDGWLGWFSASEEGGLPGDG